MTVLIAALLLAGATAIPIRPAPRDDGVEVAQLTFRSRVIVRVETQRVVAVPLRRAYREKKGPRCIDLADILGAAVLVPGSVDLAMRGGDRVRARFAASCPALDYYSGFYIAPTGDAKICSGRDVVRDRAGGECPIDRFRALLPAK